MDEIKRVINYRESVLGPKGAKVLALCLSSRFNFMLSLHNLWSQILVHIFRRNMCIHQKVEDQGDREAVDTICRRVIILSVHSWLINQRRILLGVWQRRGCANVQLIELLTSTTTFLIYVTFSRTTTKTGPTQVRNSICIHYNSYTVWASHPRMNSKNNHSQYKRNAHVNSPCSGSIGDLLSGRSQGSGSSERMVPVFPSQTTSKQRQHRSV